MTAQVAVLNTHGIALASDSAVTISGGGQSRSYPSADKIFPVTGAPLAVLHSGSASLWGVPWQLLVDMWAQQRSPAQLESVEAYARELTTWLAAQHLLVTDEAQDSFFRWTFRDFMLAVRGRIRGELEGDEDDLGPGYVEGEAAAQIDEVVAGFVSMLEERAPFKGMEGVDAAALCARLASDLVEDLEWVFDDTPRTQALDAQAKRIAELLVLRAEPFKSDAVLAFAGYGRDDYFPSLFQLTVSGAVGGVIRVYDESQAVVTNSNRVSITPLGLTEAIDAFLRGTSPAYRRSAHGVLEGYVGAVEGSPGPDVSAEAHTKLDAEFDELEWEQYLSPMLDIVETLPMFEMLRLADSLVGLASLRQLIQGQASVGGPIDLARVTKSGGFEWVRSKKGERSSSFAR